MDQKKEPSKTLIYVSNLPFETNDEQFKDLFKGFNVKTAYVARRKNGRSKGFGFVNLENDSEQSAAIEKVNGKELDSRKLIARIAYNDERRNEKGELREEFKNQNQTVASETVVYVSNLAWTVKDEDLKKIFADFNPKVATVATRRNGRSKGFGFVEFNSKEDREKALSLDNKTFSDRAIAVKPSTGYKGERSNDRSNNNNQSRNRNRNNNNNRNRNNNNNRNRSGNFNNNNNRNRRSRSPTKRSPSGNNNINTERSGFTIYVKNLPFELDETDLKDVFSEFRPKDANIPRKYGRSKGYGFVEFNNSKDQNDALRALDQSEINGRVVSISISNNRSSSPRRYNNNNNNNNNNYRRRSPRRSRRNDNNNKKTNVSSEPSKTNVYVSNIPFSIDEKKLGEFFKDLKYNKLSIPKKRNGRIFGFAFIEFASNEDQQKALKLNESQIDGRKIVVQAAFVRDNNNNNQQNN